MISHYRNVRSRVIASFCLALSLGATQLLSGCVELGLIPPPDDGGTTPPDGGDGGDGGDGETDVPPQVRLAVSNLTPQLDEQVALRCVVTNQAAEPITFDFQTSGAASNRFVENAEAGTATFIVSETDIGQAISVTCTGTNEFGQGPRSTAQVLVATSPEPPVPPP